MIKKKNSPRGGTLRGERGRENGPDGVAGDAGGRDSAGAEGERAAGVHGAHGGGTGTWGAAAGGAGVGLESHDDPHRAAGTAQRHRVCGRFRSARAQEGGGASAASAGGHPSDCGQPEPDRSAVPHHAAVHAGADDHDQAERPGLRAEHSGHDTPPKKCPRPTPSLPR